MGKKRKHSETAAVTEVNKEDSAAERPKRTLLGWKDKIEEKKESDSVVGFRNKEKVLVTCSRRISFRSTIQLLFVFLSVLLSVLLLHIHFLC